MDLNRGPLGYEPTFLLIVSVWHHMFYTVRTLRFPACRLVLFDAAWMVCPDFVQKNLSRFVQIW